MQTFAPSQLGLAGDVEVQIPKSINRLRLKGSGSRYVQWWCITAGGCFTSTIAKNKADDKEVQVKLITIEDEFYSDQQREYLMSIQENVWSAGINFSWEFDEDKTIHARHIVTNHGWKILLDRGLDIFQHFGGKESF